MVKTKYTIPRGRMTLKGQTRKLIYTVYKFMQKESIEGVNNLNQVQKRTALATGTSVNTVRRILKEAEESEDFQTPGTKRRRKKPITDIDALDKAVIRRYLRSFLITNKKMPSIKKIQVKLKTDINFEGSERSLSRIIKNLGFHWRKTVKNRRVLVESTDIRRKRIEYLEKLNKYRQDKHPIIYMDESYIHATDEPISKGKRVIIAHAGYEAGFLPNALLIFESESKIDDYYDDMYLYNYRKWLETQLLPNLPQKSVVVVNNGSYYNEQYDSAPNSDAKKSVMLSWLNEKRIRYNPKMLKPQLYHLISIHKDVMKKFNIDALIQEKGKEVLHIPPNHPDLNPTEMALASIKRYVISNNGEYNVNRVMELVKEKVDNISANEWKNICDDVKKAEESYAKSDNIPYQTTEEFVRQESENSDGSSDSDSSSSISYEDNTPGPSCEIKQEIDVMDGFAGGCPSMLRILLKPEPDSDIDT